MRSKPYLAATLLLFVAHASATAQTPETWQKFASPADGFSILMPKQPTRQTRTNPEDSRMKMNIYTSAGEEHHFSVTTLDFTGMFTPSVAGFEGFVKGFLNSICTPPRQQGLSCETTQERDLTLGGHRGRQFRLTLGGGGKTIEGVVRVYMTTKHFYTVQALGGREGDAAVDKFLGSFAVTTGAAPAARP